MSAPVIDETASTDDIPEGAVPIRLPIMALEGVETSDRRYIEPGTIQVRDLPIPLFAATRSTHGDTGDAATWHVGAITEATRVPGPEAKGYSGKALPEGSFAWEGRGWMYTDVPAAPAKSAYQLVKDKALRGNSVDMTEVVAEFQDEHGNQASDGEYVRISMQRGVIAATTLVGIPAFPDAYIELDGEAMAAADNEGLAASAWLSAELGDECSPCLAELAGTAPAQLPDGLHEFVTAEKRDRADKAGHAMPGGRYPIENEADLARAVKAVGRAGGPDGDEEDRNAVRRHIIKQAKRLKLADKIPDTWNADGTLSTGGASADVEPLADLAGDDFDPPANDYSTSGMIALVPANPNMLRVPGGDPADQLHLTLVYLGEEIDTWDEDMRAAVHLVARNTADYNSMVATIRAEMLERGEDVSEWSPPDYKYPSQEGPLTVGVFAHAVFNPNGDNGFNPATVYLFDGGGHRQAIEELAGNLAYAVAKQVGDVNMPQQHRPFVPHVTAGYGVPVEQLTYTGPVEFDRIRVALGDEVTDYVLGGDDMALVASVADLPPLEWFEDPNLDGPTALTVQDDGRVYGHLAAWNTCHTGIPGRCVTAPRSRTGYAYFKVHATRAVDADGNAVTVPVGYGTLSRSDTVGGHAAINLSARETAAHYDNTCTAAFELNVGEDDHGIWVAGRLMPGLDEETRHKAFGAVFSGDWRPIRGNRELLAALAVNTPGFPVTRALVAAGQPQALVAAGVVQREPADMAEALAAVGARGDALGSSLTEDLAELAAWARRQHMAELRDRMASVFSDSNDLRDMADAEVEMLLSIDGDHPWLSGDLMEVRSGQGAEPLRTDVYAGGKVLHLPPYIKRIAKHLEGKGMTKSRAIATAVNAAKKMCSTGDLNFPGDQDVNPGSRAEACKAVAQWKKDRPGAR